MSKTIYQKSLFVFRRDLRLFDNSALNRALELSDEVICCFVADPAFHRQAETRIFAKTFLYHAIAFIDRQLKGKGAQLNILFGRPMGVLPGYVKEQGIDAVFFNQDYTASGIARDKKVQENLEKLGVDVRAYHDQTLFPPGFVLKNDGSPYTVFTPFYNKARQYSISRPEGIAEDKFSPGKQPGAFPARQLQSIWNIRPEECDVLRDLSTLLQHTTSLDDYDNVRDFPALAGTSGLSSHLKFGTLSIRQAYWHIFETLGDHHPLLRQLYWRDFYHHIGYHFPHVFKSAFRRQYANIPWNNNRRQFKAWCDGKTGFPIVDAGMRELNATGYMHNRVRMIVASFLVKDLHIDWRWGEKYFSDKLIDYDSAVNNGNWQWAASTGCDAQPYFRIFNPWLQQKKFDPHCEYIKQWVPELAELEPKAIHQWEKTQAMDKYPAPIIDHKTHSGMAKQLFSDVKSA